MNSTQELDSVVERVSQLLHRHIGLRPEPGLRSRLRRCIRDGAVGRGQDLGAYLDTLLVCSEARQSLFNRVTVQETAFFRHPEHFGLLAREILPTLARPVTIWSAGCSTGQEAFSLAMLLEEHGVDGCVIATDVSTEALQRTGAGRYNTGELGGLAPERIACHLTRDGNAWVSRATSGTESAPSSTTCSIPSRARFRRARSPSVATSSSTSPPTRPRVSRQAGRRATRGHLVPGRRRNHLAPQRSIRDCSFGRYLELQTSSGRHGT